ncbi:MAG TPA: phosphoribosylamine--glycine ligase, partial [Peptococcaceae bacterium]|nr:phosphoribosylamine--glycine ligase [Peptococcaceae bacterium]
LTDGKLVSNGGRVLGITAFGATIEEAVQNVYAGVEKVNYQGMHYRRDIAHRALNKGS